MFYVYVLVSEKDQRTYCGYTKDLLLRLQRHHTGQVAATKHRRPLTLFFSEEFKTMKDAKNRELWWKSTNGRRKIKKFLEFYAPNRKSQIRR